MSEPKLIEATNVSELWARVFLDLHYSQGHERTPLVATTTFSGGEIEELDAVRGAADLALNRYKQQPIRTVANTIFPASLWRIFAPDRQAFYDEYLRNLPLYYRWDTVHNRSGLYFGRMIGYGVTPKTGKPVREDGTPCLTPVGNQLEHVIRSCRKGVRRSKFQIAIFDPWRDHKNDHFLPFPCLGYVSFIPDFKAQTLQMTAHYPTQQLFVKGYGNYLGLCQLGAFVAEQTKLSLARFTCVSGIAKIDDAPGPTKSVRKDLVRSLTDALASLESDADPGCAA